MNVAVDRHAAVIEPGAAAEDLNGWPDVNGNARVFLPGDFKKSRRVGQQADAKAIVGDRRGC